MPFLDSPTEMLPAALQYLGFKPDSQKPDELKKTEDCSSIRPYTAYFPLLQVHFGSGQRQPVRGGWLLR